MFNHNEKLQSYINIIYQEGRYNELIRICDMYHYIFPTLNEALEWGLNLGIYIGRFRFVDMIWRFNVPDEKTTLYFIGVEEDVYKKIYNTL